VTYQIKTKQGKEGQLIVTRYLINEAKTEVVVFTLKLNTEPGQIWSPGLQVRALPGASDKGLTGYSMPLVREHLKHCYPFVIRFSDFTHLSDGICADNSEHFCPSGSGMI
jgi:hypothetical protein